MLKKFAGMVIRFRYVVILLTILITAILGYFIKDMKINPDFTSYLPTADSTVQLYNKIGKEYGGNLLALVVLEAEDIFQADIIQDINNLTSAFKIIDGVSHVSSITSTLDIRADQDGIEIGRLIDQYDLPTTQAELGALKRYILSKKMYRGQLVSEDATATLIICRLHPDSDEIRIAKEIKKAVSNNNIKSKAYFGGFPSMMLDVNNMIINDLLLLLPLVAFAIIVVLAISFRSLRGVALPLLAVGISTVWTIGLMCLLGISISIVSDIIPVILFAVGSAYSIHVINRQDEWIEHLNGKVNAMIHHKQALADIVLPVLLAAFTTMVGFISFVFGSYLTTIREFGIFATLGVLFSCALSITFVPSVASLMHPTSKQEDRKKIRGHSALRVISRTIQNHPRMYIAIGIILVVLAALGIPRIQRKVNVLDYFKPGTDVRLTENLIKQKFGGSMPIQILVSGDISSPEVLEAMKDFQEFLESYHDIHHAQSVADLIEEMSFVIGEGREIPDSRAKVGNLWFLLEGEEIMSQMVNAERTEAVIQATLESSLQTDRVKVIVDGVNDYIQEHKISKYEFQQTGMPSIHYRLDQSIKRSQIQSMIIAATAIFFTLLLLLRSVSGGLVGLIPIGFSLMGIFGCMGFFGIPLDIATALVGSISIGVGIDYTIHFLERFKKEFRRSNDVGQALKNTLQTAGRAVSINVIAVTTGFLVLVMANLIPLQRFGILIAVTMLASGIGTIFIMPATLVLMKPKFLLNKQNIRTKKGD
jgi:predicted RND superfamily exporter protein